MEIEYGRVEISREDAAANRADLQALLALSRAWAEEGCCPGYYANGPDEYAGKEIRVARREGQIIAYALGHFRTLDRATSYGSAGEQVFELDELYVLPEYRGQGVGQALFRRLEADVRARADVIELIAASRDYAGLMKFYIDELGMTFNHALLVKRLPPRRA